MTARESTQPITPTVEPYDDGEIGDRSDVDHADVVAVGAGLAGLTAAVTAARGGAQVVLVDARADRGGRARSEAVEGFSINHGAHALYLAGPGTAVLKGLGIAPAGRLPRQSGFGWWIEGRRVPLRSLSAVGGVDGARALRRLVLPRRRREGAAGRSMSDWLDDNVPDGGRRLAEMLVRTTCYVADLSDLDAGEALDQIARGARGVRYLHGGWQSLVVGLEQVARDSGVSFVTDKAEGVRCGEGDEGGVLVELRGGRTLAAASVVLAVGGPAHAESLLSGASPQVSAWAAAADPILAACLDVAVTGSPRRSPSTTYGLGQPVYAVDHARTARVAPDGGAMWHALFYEPDRWPEVDHRAVLESMLDECDPGWRGRTAAVVFRKRSVVAHDRVRPVADSDRPTVEVPDLDGVYVAGDWLTGHGMLADAPVTSGADAGRAATAWSVRRAARHRSGTTSLPSGSSAPASPDGSGGGKLSA